MHSKLNRLLLPLFLLLCTATVFGQPIDNSPFSRFGIGNLQNTNFAPLGAMGNVSSTYQSAYHLNPGNPASYASLNFTSFEVGAYGKFAYLESPTERIRTQTGNLSYLALGFPLFNPLNRITQKKDRPYDWGMSLGLVPFSQVAYNLVDTTNYQNEIGSVISDYVGEGQLYKLYLGSGWRYKGLSAGINFNYIFGRNGYEKRSRLVDLPSSLLNIFYDETNTSGLTFDIGVQYKWTITPETEENAKKDKTSLIVGAKFTPPMNVRSNSRFSQIVINNVSGATYSDTVAYVPELISKTAMPLSFSGGLAMEKTNKWFVGVNYEYSKWSDYERPTAEPNATSIDELADAWTIGIGAEITPDARSYNKFMRRVRYRVGGFYGQDPRVILGNNLTNYGITFGFGLPIRLARGVPSFVNLGFEFGRLGSPDVIEENYFKTTVAFTLNDNTWFYKRKFK